MQTDRFVALVEIPDEFVGMIQWDGQGADGDSALGDDTWQGQGTMVRGQRGFLRGLWFHLVLVLVLVLGLADLGSGKTDLSQGYFDKSWIDGAGSILWVSANGPANSDPIRFESAKFGELIQGDRSGDGDLKAPTLGILDPLFERGNFQPIGQFGSILDRRIDEDFIDLEFRCDRKDLFPFGGLDASIVGIMDEDDLSGARNLLDKFREFNLPIRGSFGLSQTPFDMPIGSVRTSSSLSVSLSGSLSEADRFDVGLIRLGLPVWKLTSCDAPMGFDRRGGRHAVGELLDQREFRPTQRSVPWFFKIDPRDAQVLEQNALLESVCTD